MTTAMMNKVINDPTNTVSLAATGLGQDKEVVAQLNKKALQQAYISISKQNDAQYQLRNKANAKVVDAPTPKNSGFSPK